MAKYPYAMPKKYKAPQNTGEKPRPKKRAQKKALWRKGADAIPSKRAPRLSPLRDREWQGAATPELPLEAKRHRVIAASQAAPIESLQKESKDFRPPDWAGLHMPEKLDENSRQETGPESGQEADQEQSEANNLGQVASPEPSRAENQIDNTAGKKTDLATGLSDFEKLAEQKRLLQQQKKGENTLRSLEKEARTQEIERVRQSRIEIPKLDLKVQEGNSFLHMAHLQKRYGRKLAVADVSISLRQGEVVGLLGPNGAGKTTCFYMIAGFVHPTKGSILLDEENISKWPMYKRARRGISYLPQEASIFRSLTVEQNLLAILEYRRDMNRRARREMAEFLMERLGVQRLRKQKAYTLSGGERRRVEVARALTLEPSFLLLDEPFAGIDPIAVSEIKGIIRALAQSNIGILITDHNVRETLDITDRSYIVNLGEILVSGSRAELIASKAAREVYLGAEFN